MPAFFTHYLFGKMSYQAMRETKLKEMIRRHKKVYALGLSGPDIFFYFIPDLCLGVNKPGSILHEKSCGAFLQNMLKEAEQLTGEERKIALAYLSGFIGHYELDTHCHPYVYAYIGRMADERKDKTAEVTGEEKTGIHFRFEGAMDYYFLKNYTNRTPAVLNQNRITRLTLKERRVVCRLVAESCNRTYGSLHLTSVRMGLVLDSVWLVMHLIRDRKGRREKILAPIEKKLYHHPFCSGLFVNDNCYGIDQREWQEMNKLFRKGMNEYQKTMEKLACVVEVLPEEKVNFEELNEKEHFLLQEFYDQLGSRSYHSGETVE